MEPPSHLSIRYEAPRCLVSKQEDISKPESCRYNIAGNSLEEPGIGRRRHGPTRTWSLAVSGYSCIGKADMVGVAISLSRIRNSGSGHGIHPSHVPNTKTLIFGFETYLLVTADVTDVAR